jgi:hypothetical protein
VGLLTEDYGGMGGRNREDKLSIFTSVAHLSLVLWLFNVISRGSAQCLGVLGKIKFKVLR